MVMPLEPKRGVSPASRACYRERIGHLTSMRKSAPFLISPRPSHKTRNEMSTHTIEAAYAAGGRVVDTAERRAAMSQFMRWLHEPDLTEPAQFLGEIERRLRHGEDVAHTMEVLCDGLWWLRQTKTPEEWDRFVRLARLHPVRELVHEDPFTLHSYRRPRGYAGDAGLIDLIYYDQGHAAIGSISELGQLIFERNRDASGPLAVRERRNFMASLIDRKSVV